MKKTKDKIIYYQDEVNDDFQNTRTNKTVRVDEKYRYGPKNCFTAFGGTLFYFFVLPFLWIFMFCFKRIKVVGKKNLKELRKTGFIMFANHTSILDVFLGPISVAFPRRTYVISNKDAISIWGITGLVKALGALPVADTPTALKNLEKFSLKKLDKRQAIMIFPEAHIWPYYTGLRPFLATSFKFCVKANVPAVPVAVTYLKPKGKNWQNKKPRQQIFIGNPIYPEPNISLQDNAFALRDKTVKFIKEKVINKENYPYITYIKKEII